MFVLNVKSVCSWAALGVGGQGEGGIFLHAGPHVQARSLIYLKRYLDALVPEGASLRTRVFASVCIISGT